jgi:hypothetical protein
MDVNPNAGATEHEIRAAYNRLMKRIHPNVGGSTFHWDGELYSWGADQEFAPSCGDAHERLPANGARQPMFGAILRRFRSWLYSYSP